MGKLDDPRTEGRLLLFVADFITVLLLTAGGALSFLSGYNVETDLGAVLFFCLFASAVSTALHSLTRPWWSVGAAGVIALIFWPAWETVSPILNWLGRKMGLLSGLTGLSAAVPGKNELLPVLLLLCAVLAWVMGWMAVRVRRWYLAALLSLTLVLPAIQMGVLPMWGAVLASFAGWGTMLLTALYGRRDPGGLGRAQLLSLSGMGALLLFLVMALPMEGYLRPQWATDARTSMIQSLNRQLESFFDMDEINNSILADLGLDLSIPEASGGTGGSGVSTIETFGGGQSRREDLLSLGPRRYQNRQVMTVETDDPNAPGQMIYLLSGTLNTYTGESWEEELCGTTQSAWFPAMTAPDAEAYTMTIRYNNLGGTWSYPYRLVGGGNPDESGRLSAITGLSSSDAPVLQPESGGSYQITYRPGGPEDGFSELEGGWQEMEWSYRYESRAFEDIYLEVPAGLRASLTPLAEELERTPVAMDTDIPDQFLGPIVTAARTAAKLSELAVYDLGAPAMEPGEDFVEHFLAEGRGYCVHFATAGAMLLRMQGIPARYAAGYVAQLNSRGSARVLDSGAHAWVEIYLNGYGWYPVEMTPGYAGGGSGVELDIAPEADIPDEPDKPEDSEIPEDETPDPVGPVDTVEEDVSGEEAAEAEPAIAIPWRALGRIVLVLAALSGGYALALLTRRQARMNPDTNRSAIDAYRRYRRVLRLGGEEDIVMEELARKAKFSQHTLTEEERAAVWQRLENAGGTAKERQKPWKRWVLSLLRPLL